jgi:tetratricopeptide (TPR) repeat protein
MTARCRDSAGGVSHRNRALVLGLIALIGLADLAACGRSAAQNSDSCVLFDGSPKDRIAACTKLIESGQFTGRQLAQAFVTRGAAYDDNKQYELAIREYTKAIELQPDFALAFNGRGSAYDENGQLDLALANYKEAIRLDPSFSYSWANRASVEMRRRDFVAALSDYDTALKLDTNNGWALYGRGVAKSWSGDKKGAAVDLATANKIDPGIAKSYAGIGIQP